MKKTDIYNVYLFKGIAIMGVLFCHYSQIFNIDFLFNKISLFGQMGCQIFFLLSCFTLSISFEKKHENYFSFLKKRYMKLFLEWYIMIILFALIASKNNINIFDKTYLIGIILNLFFLHGLNNNLLINNKIVYGGWFVGTIVIFYILFPFLYKLFKKYNHFISFYIFIFSCVIMSLITLLFNVKVNNNSYFYYFFLNQLPCFSLGFYLYYLYSNKLINKVKNSFSKFLFLFLIAIILFYKNFSFSFIFLPFIFGLSIIYAYIFVNNHFRIKKNNFFVNLLYKFGLNSWYIYLCQSIIIFFIFPWFLNCFAINSIYIYIIFLPLCFAFCYFAGICLLKFSQMLRSILRGVV